MNQEEKSEKETRRKDKQNADEANRVVKEQERKKAYLAREQVIGKASDSRRTQRAEKHSSEEAEQLAREQARRKAYFDREKSIADSHQARKSKDKA